MTLHVQQTHFQVYIQQLSHWWTDVWSNLYRTAAESGDGENSSTVSIFSSSWVFRPNWQAGVKYKFNGSTRVHMH